MGKMANDLPDEQVVVKVTTCKKCDGIVQAGVKHMMTKRQINEMGQEAILFNLSVSEMPLLDYRKDDTKWCHCNKTK